MCSAAAAQRFDDRVCYAFAMSPTAKKVTVTDAAARAFEDAEEGPPLTDDERAALAEAAEDPRWVRLRRGDAFERLVCEDKKSDDEE